MTPHSSKPTWRNWAGTVSSSPAAFMQPTSEAEISQIIQRAAQAGQQIRAVGAGHSFTPVAASSDIMLSLDKLSGLEHYDPHTGEVTVWAGTRLNALGEALHALGRAQENLGDIDHQSIAGAISTGTHGTGLALGSVGTQVTGMRLIDAHGQVQQLQGDDPRLQAARLSLGALGIITSVTLRTQPAYNLQQDVSKATFDEMLHLWPEYAQAARHFEFFWIPHTATVQVKRSVLSEAAGKGRGWQSHLNELVLENGAVWALSEAHRRFPGLTGPVTRTMSWGVGSLRRTEAAHRAFASQRLVKFKEMEYALPLEALSSALKDLREMLERQKLPISFPVEVRMAAADDIYLSTAYGAPRGYIAIHAYQGAPHQDYFRESEQIFLHHAGRPHWGKIHSLGAAEFERLYPRFGDFKLLQNHMDPQRRFGSPYLRHILGV